MFRTASQYKRIECCGIPTGRNLSGAEIFGAAIRRAVPFEQHPRAVSLVSTAEKYRRTTSCAAKLGAGTGDPKREATRPIPPDQPDARPARNPAVRWVVATPLASIALIVFCFAAPPYFAMIFAVRLSPIGGVEIPDATSIFTPTAPEWNGSLYPEQHSSRRLP